VLIESGRRAGRAGGATIAFIATTSSAASFQGDDGFGLFTHKRVKSSATAAVVMGRVDPGMRRFLFFKVDGIASLMSDHVSVGVKHTRSDRLRFYETGRGAPMRGFPRLVTQAGARSRFGKSLSRVLDQHALPRVMPAVQPGEARRIVATAAIIRSGESTAFPLTAAT